MGGTGGGIAYNREEFNAIVVTAACRTQPDDARC